MDEPLHPMTDLKHDLKDHTAVASTESAAATSPSRRAIDMAIPSANPAAPTVHEHEHDLKPKTDVNVTENGHKEVEEDVSGDVSTRLAEADEAIAAVGRGSAPPFFFEKTPFGKELPLDLRNGTATFNLDYSAKYIDMGKDGSGSKFYLGLPPMAKAEVAFNIYCPGPREIRAIWSITHQSWVYTSLRKPNIIPFVAVGFGGAMASHAAKVFHTAPILGMFMPYGWFNYELDTLVLDYTHCARSQKEREEYSTALYTALQMIRIHRMENMALPNFKHVKISYCPFTFGPNDLPSSKQALEWAFGADELKLVAHEH